jgi:tetratricopeptide (TPR) repeat protein
MMATSTTSSYFDSQDSSQLSSHEEVAADAKDKQLEELRGLLSKAHAIREEGNLRSKEGKHKDAIELYAQSIESIPAALFKGHFTEECNELRLRSFTNVIRVGIAAEYYREAISQCMTGLAEFPGNVPLKYLCGLAYEKLGGYEDAVNLLKQALEYEPGNQQVKTALIRCLVSFIQKLKKKEEAEYKAMFKGKLVKSQTGQQTTQVEGRQAPQDPRTKQSEGWNWVAGVTALAGVSLLGFYLWRRTAA